MLKRKLKWIVFFGCLLFLLFQGITDGTIPMTDIVQKTGKTAEKSEDGMTSPVLVLTVPSESGMVAQVREEGWNIVFVTPQAEKAQENLTDKPEDYPVTAPVRNLNVRTILEKTYPWSRLTDLNYLKSNFYIVNSSTVMTKEDFSAEQFVKWDFSMQKSDEPQILIYHTHASESFSDSRPGEKDDTVVGVGELLSSILTEKYGYGVIHDTTVFDRKEGKDNRSGAYDDAVKHVEEILKRYPSIEVIIDLHRDAGEKRVVMLGEKQVARIMLFNGLSRNTSGILEHLPNENLEANLAFSFQMKVLGDELYPGLMNRIFLKDYRYNMHLKEKYLLVELGTQKNTVEEAKNAMEPFADILAALLNEK